MREKAEKFTFQAEVDRMMKLIINSLYKNKEIFLRELISNASDALDKIRLLSLTDKKALGEFDELSIKIRADKENQMLHITDTGIGMTKSDLVAQLGTIAKSGTSEFLSKMSDLGTKEMNDMIGQFGVGFYSAFLVADRVMVTSKNNDDEQYIWESDAASFTVSKDPRGNTLQRGTTISLHMKEEALEYLEQTTIRDLIKKYSQFINFNIYIWDSRVEQVEEKVDDGEGGESSNYVDKTIWDWTLLNDNKPIWTRKTSEIEESEYEDFYKSFSKEYEPPLSHTHFTAEGNQ